MKKYQRLVSLYRNHGALGLISSVYTYLYPQKAHCLKRCQLLISEKIGLEVGGPSRIFSKKGHLPLYPFVKSLDNCNFSKETTWEGHLTEGHNFHYDKQRAPGKQYLAEATNLVGIESGTYDFVLSSHAIEHVANPILALSEWLRVLKDHGLLVLVVPHKDGTFDHLRPVTKMMHLLSDFEQGIEEDDLTHLKEILELHDLSRDPSAGAFEAFKARSEQNLYNRCLHHHVFDSALVAQMVDHMGLQILAIEALLPMHIILIAKKLETSEKADNSQFLGTHADFLQLSPFESDWREAAHLPQEQSKAIDTTVD